MKSCLHSVLAKLRSKTCIHKMWLRVRCSSLLLDLVTYNMLAHILVFVAVNSTITTRVASLSVPIQPRQAVEKTFNGINKDSSPVQLNISTQDGGRNATGGHKVSHPGPEKLAS